MQLALQGVYSVVRNKYFWYALIALVAYFVIKKYWYQLTDKLAPSYEQPTTDQTGTVIPISATRLFRLRELATSLQLQIYDWKGWTDLAILDEVAYTTDAELKYIANYYKQVLLKNKATLYADLDDEILPYTGSDDIILTRLKQMGLQ